MAWREYHEFTKHTVEKLRRNQHFLDWANMPNPFRHYDGVPILDLPADPPAPQLPTLDVLEGRTGNTLAKNGSAFLSQLLFYSASISATKRVSSTGSTYALRVNPSSGNLHPTEFHFCTRGLVDWPDGLYHYRPSSHMAEQRAIGDFVTQLVDSTAPLVFVLTSIAWREAWKYRDRAYRYCLHDIGHAWQALALAARAIGCDATAAGQFPDDDVAHLCRFHEVQHQGDEWPMLTVELRGAAIPLREPDAREMVWHGGQANQLSKETIVYKNIDEIHEATKLSSHQAASPFVAAPPAPVGAGNIKLPAPASSTRPFGEAVRMRRSALDFVGGDQSMSLTQLAAILG